MKIIFSRKGFDGKVGRYPSAIVNGQPRSFPIPDSGGVRKYCHLENDLGELIKHLTYLEQESCHLDPDLDETVIPRTEGWRGAFGQVNGAQGHLKNQDVSIGDIFLFWGWFKAAEKYNGQWKYIEDSEDAHTIFGWLQIGEIERIGNKPANALAKYPWLKDHPHVQGSDLPASNTIYIAAEKLHIPGSEPNFPGWGVFKNGYRLTAPSSPRSRWAAPDWLNPVRGGVGLSRTKESRWDAGGFLKKIGPGQEFVANIENRPDAIEWLKNLFRNKI